MAGAQSPEVQSKILLWRQKAIEGTLTEEEATEAIRILRGDRASAAASASPAKRAAKATKIIPTSKDLLSELGMDEEGGEE